MTRRILTPAFIAVFLASTALTAPAFATAGLREACNILCFTVTDLCVIHMPLTHKQTQSHIPAASRPPHTRTHNYASARARMCA